MTKTELELIKKVIEDLAVDYKRAILSEVAYASQLIERELRLKSLNTQKD